jgi:nucleoside phosphorylase/predicted nucleotidyltransferase
MSDQHPLNLYSLIVELGQTEWIDEIRIFGSRRYLSNASYGSDIDLLIVPNRHVSIDKVRDIIDEPYVDAFLLDSHVAVSAMNDTRINVSEAGTVKGLDAITLWSRTNGWLTGEDYRTLDVISDKVPAMTRPNRGAIIIFCALASEFAAVRNRLGTGTEKTHARIPPYYRAYVNAASGKERLVIAVQTGVAGVNAGVSATRILDYFDEPAFAVLVGITAGLKDQKPTPSSPVLGDILVPTATVDVESGKLTPKGKEPAGQTFPLSPYRQRAIASWSGFNAWADQRKRLVDGKETPPKIVSDCTLACTASVIAYNKYAQSLKQHDRKIAGIEMEAVGIATACIGRCDLLIVKAISDWADEEKGDSQHEYCMQVSADLTISLIETGII